MNTRIATLLFLLALAVPALAQVEQAIVQIDGMF